MLPRQRLAASTEHALVAAMLGTKGTAVPVDLGHDEAPENHQQHSALFLNIKNSQEASEENL